MGHQRLGRLPRTRRWAEVIRLLDDSPQQTATVANAVMVAAQRRLDELADENALPYCAWLLTRLTQAARGGDFEGDARLLGAPVSPGESAISFIARLSQDVSATLARSPGAGPFAELAVQSFRLTLIATIGTQSKTLFGSTADDLRLAFRSYSTVQGFGRLSHQFLGDFMARTLRYFLDREIANHIGPESGLATVDDAREFAHAIDQHARETAAIMHDFAGEWYSKHNWQSDGEISREEVRGFVGQALKKIRLEFAMEAQPA